MSCQWRAREKRRGNSGLVEGRDGGWDYFVPVWRTGTRDVRVGLLGPALGLVKPGPWDGIFEIVGQPDVVVRE